jgi:hypothetical protein
MKNWGIVAMAALAFGLVACDDSNGSAICEVTRTATTVKVVNDIPGLAGYNSTVTDQGNYVTIESEFWYENQSYADKDCAEWKEEARGWRDGSMKVTCSGKSVYISEYDEGTLNSHERNFNEMCEDFWINYNNGAYDNF